jgi:hypothetical protein
MVRRAASGLRERPCVATSGAMITRDQWRKFIDHPVVEWTLFAVGVVLLILSPLVGAIPGPGGIIVAGLGLALILKTSMWAKRRYVRFKRWQPKAGRWTDWALQRRSAKRREAIRKSAEQPSPLSDGGNAS